MENRPNLVTHIAALERALKAAQEEEQRCKEALKQLRQQYADDLFAERQLVRQLREDRHHIQQDYEKLRLRKGGFGLKMLFLSGFSGFASAVLLCLLYSWFLRPSPPYLAAFECYRDAHLFHLECALSEARFDEVERLLDEHARQPENESIQIGLVFARKLVSAAHQGCDKVKHPPR